MHGPQVAGWLLVVLGAATAAARLARPRPSPHEVLMGAGMALMAVPASVWSPPPWTPALYALGFGAAAVRAFFRARRSAHQAHHGIGAAAMVYMAVAMGPVTAGGGGAHAAGGPVGAPLLTGALLVYYGVYALGTGLRLTPAAAGGPPAGVLRSPEFAAACRVSMAIGMFAMLLTL